MNPILFFEIFILNFKRLKLKLVNADKLVWSKKFSLRLKNKKKWSTVNFDYFSMFLFVRISGNGSIKMSSQVWIYIL